MVKLPGQSLALIAMIASVINAQCALSCSLQSIVRTSASHLGRVDPDHRTHACCPHRGVPKPKEQKDEVPCQHPAPTADQARLNKNSVNSIPAGVVIGLNHEYCHPLAEIDLDPLAATDSSGLSHLSSFFILRI